MTNYKKISPKQLEILTYIREYKSIYGNDPTLDKIAIKLGKSVPTIHEHVKALRIKGYLKSVGMISRNIGSNDPNEDITDIPLLGSVSAGGGLENLEYPELIKIQRSLLSPVGKHFALLVKGTSMIDDGILPDDIVIIRSQPYADNGDVVIALIDDDGKQLAVIKRFYHHGNKIELRPKNPELESKWYELGGLEVRGKFISLLRKG